MKLNWKIRMIFGLAMTIVILLLAQTTANRAAELIYDSNVSESVALGVIVIYVSFCFAPIILISIILLQKSAPLYLLPGIPLLLFLLLYSAGELFPEQLDLIAKLALVLVIMTIVLFYSMLKDQIEEWSQRTEEERLESNMKNLGT